jgi:hypothetical protein
VKYYGRAALSDLFGDGVIYRKLDPVDLRLPRLNELRSELSLSQNSLPRKKTSQYGEVIAHQLQLARELDLPGTPLERVIMVGDTRMNDGTAFLNICHHGEWSGAAFIGAERRQPANVDLETFEESVIYNANRWQSIRDFEGFLKQQDFAVDEHTAILLDIDKTLLAARGRNDQTIDQARLGAAKITASSLMGKEFDQADFSRTYNDLNSPEFHPFTTDNQDYLVYLCLIFSSGLFEHAELIEDIQNKRISSFEAFVSIVDQKKESLAKDMKTAHQHFSECLQMGDPTPFKVFRAHEFKNTVDLMGYLDDDTPVEKLLAEEIVITHEIHEITLEWKAQGALVFGLSDKPDEATLPSNELAARGYLPVHQVQTHVVGA